MEHLNGFFDRRAAVSFLRAQRLEFPHAIRRRLAPADRASLNLRSDVAAALAPTPDPAYATAVGSRVDWHPEIALSSTPRILISFLAACALAWCSLPEANAAAAKHSKSAAKAPARTKASTAKGASSKKTKARGKAATRRVVEFAPVVVPTVDASKVSHDANSIAREFNRWLDDVEASHAVSGLAAAVIKDEQVLVERTVGYADTSTGERVGGGRRRACRRANGGAGIARRALVAPAVRARGRDAADRLRRHACLARARHGEVAGHGIMACIASARAHV